MPNRFTYPRPEYPRPDRQRGSLEGINWFNLNGPWQFRFDRHKSGVEQIIVPFCWESLAAWGEGDSAGNENYFSTRGFRIPLGATRAKHPLAPPYSVARKRRSLFIPDTVALRR